MEFATAIAQLPITHQAAFSALNCEKMLPSVAKFDSQEEVAVSGLFEKATAALYAFALEPSTTTINYDELKEQIESRWPDLDETDNEFASYAFDAFVAVSEALGFVLSGETTHAVNCSAAVLDTVDMYVQETAEPHLPTADLEAYIQANPFMVQERTRQAALLERLAAITRLGADDLARLREINSHALLVYFDALPY